MKLSKSTSPFCFVAVAGILLTIAMFSSCSTADIQAVSNAVSALETNKALAEQFVRDVKGAYDPADPQYRSIMSQYEQSRDTYNEYISQVEAAARTGRRLTVPEESDDMVKKSAVRFISSATRSLDPKYSDRGLSLDRAITIPNNLMLSLTKLPTSARRLLSDGLRRELRWNSWSQLN
jgi:hypothetical protein